MYLHILTPLYDPSGNCLNFFTRLKNSVLQQVGVDIMWHVSVQSLSPVYASEIDILKGVSRVRFYNRSRAASLSEHLSLILAECPAGPVHILCQDDFYKTTQAAAAISKALQTSPVVHVSPQKKAPAAPRITSRRSHSIMADSVQRQRNQVFAGVNVFGGLSSLAWRADALSAFGPIRFDLMADCQIRADLWRQIPSIPMQVDGLLEEEQWAGQAQHSMHHLRHVEAKRWVRLHPHGRRRSVGFALEALRYRNLFLTQVWILNSLASRTGFMP